MHQRREDRPHRILGLGAAVLAARHLGIDMRGVQHAGAEARSRDHAEEMLDALARHVEEHDCLPQQKESALGKWGNNVSTGQNELTPQRKARK